MSEIEQPECNHVELDSMVVTNSLCKRFGDFDALADCSLQVRSGAIFGLLGPNGAGKTTLIRLLLGFLKPTSGNCSVNSFSSVDDGVSVRRSVAYLPGEANLPQHMRGRSVLKFFADMHPGGSLKRSLAIADDLELDLRRYVAFMSTGMRQKLALAVVLGIESPLMILDEPTANLDPTVRATVLDYVRQAGRKGRTVILSSHVLSEIEETCDRVAFLRRGRLAHQQDMSDIQQQHRVTASSCIESITVPEELKSHVELQLDDADHGVRIDTQGDLATLLPWLESLSLRDMRIEPLALRSVYDSVHFRKDTVS